jgi:hypothetical protein
MTEVRDEAGTWFHPLISPFNPRRLGRRRLLMIGGGGLAAAAAAPHLRLVAAQDTPASPEAVTGLEITGDEDAVALLEQAAQVMADLETFSFEITTVAGETSIFGMLTLESIEGSVRRPIDFTATIEASTPIGSMSVTAVGVDGTAWVQNPLSDGEWVSLEEVGDISAIINPDSLILGAINVIQNATIEGSDQIDGVEAVRIAGTVDISDAADRISDGSAELPSELSTEPLGVLIWLDDENHVLEIELDGAILEAESDDVVRSFRFFGFDEPVQIEAPEV